MSEPVTIGIVVRLVAAIAAAFSVALGFVWSVARGAKRCSDDSRVKAECADAVVEGIERRMGGMHDDMIKGFDRVHQRLDQHFGGD